MDVDEVPVAKETSLKMPENFSTSAHTKKVISKICNFKLDNYHKVNCISKEIGNRNNRDTWRR